MRRRKKLCAGNWKMHKSPSESRAYFSEWTSVARPSEGVEVLIFPPAYNLFVLSEKAPLSNIKFGAQNIHFAVEGAFTGELSAEVVKSFGATYALIGHSERRSLFSEDDDFIAQKVEAALRAGLIPVLCIGETRAERDADKTKSVILRQLREGLKNVQEPLRNLKDQLLPLVLAYEPVWAIGTGQVATPEMAEEVHLLIRQELMKLLEQDDVSILYGGSVKPDNASVLISQPNVDGFLVGGASLKPADFLQILSVF